MKLTELANVCRAAGLSVVEEQGRDKATGQMIPWQQFGRSGNSGYSDARPTHVMVHHTATRTTIKNDVAYANHNSSIRPLANLMLARNGDVHVLAGGPTNTNGRGSSSSWGNPVPLNAMNVYAIGIEVCNNGVGEHYPEPQQDALVTLVAALCVTWGIPPHHVRGHFEWAPTRKIDPAGSSRWANGSAKWDMDLFRSDIETLLTQTPDDESSDTMPYLLIPPPERNGSPWLLIDRASVRPASSFDVNDGVPQRDMADIPQAWRAEQYDALHAAAGLS